MFVTFRHSQINSYKMNLPPFDKYPEISSDRIVLRQIIPEEISQIVEISFYDAKPAASELEAIEMLLRIDEDYRKGESIHWGIVDKNTHTIVGTCGYYRGIDKGIGELGCILRPAFRGQGYMTAAMQLAIEFGLGTIKLDKIIAITSKENTKAIQLLARLNFTKTKELPAEEVEFELLHKTS